MKLIIILIAISFTLFPQQKYFNLGDFNVSKGGVIKNAMLGYRTVGKLNQDSSNAIIFPAWFGGRSKTVAILTGPDKFADSTKYFVILPDPFGNGVSSSPSNYTGGEFPEVTMEDNIRAQYRLVTEELKLKGLFAGIGGSMGGMQMFQWAVQYPGFIKKIVPYVGTPKQGASNKLLYQAAINQVLLGRKYNMPEKDILPLLNMYQYFLGRTPEWVENNTAPEKVDSMLNTFFTPDTVTFPSGNWLTQMTMMRDHDITKNFNGSLEEAAKAIKSDMLIIVSDSDLLVYNGKAKEIAGYLDAPLVVLKGDCGHLQPSCELAYVADVIKKFLGEK